MHASDSSLPNWHVSTHTGFHSQHPSGSRVTSLPRRRCPRLDGFSVTSLPNPPCLPCIYTCSLQRYRGLSHHFHPRDFTTTLKHSHLRFYTLPRHPPTLLHLTHCQITR